MKYIKFKSWLAFCILWFVGAAFAAPRILLVNNLKLLSKTLGATILFMLVLLSTQAANATLVTSSFVGAFTANQNPSSFFDSVSTTNVGNVLGFTGFVESDFSDDYFTDTPLSLLGAIAYENDFSGVDPSISHNWMLGIGIQGTLELVGVQEAEIFPFFFEEWFPVSDIVGPFSLFDVAGLLAGTIGSCNPVIFEVGTGFCASKGDFESGGIAFGLEEEPFLFLLDIVADIVGGTELYQFLGNASQINIDFIGQLQLTAIDVPEPSILAIFGLGLIGLTGLRRRRK